jgi:hypothetical protein
MERTKSVGLEAVLKERMIAIGSVTDISWDQVYVRGINDILFVGGECFDDYEVVGYNKASGKSQSESRESGLRALDEPLIRVDNNNIVRWEDKLKADLSSRSSVRFVRDREYSRIENAIYAIDNFLTKIGVRLINKLKEEEIVGGTSYDCSYAHYTDLDLTDINYLKYTAAIKDAETMNTSTMTQGRSLADLFNINMTFHYDFTIKSIKLQYNQFLSDGSSGGGNLFSNVNLPLTGQVSSAVTQNYASGSLTNGTIGVSYNPPPSSTTPTTTSSTTKLITKFGN